MKRSSGKRSRGKGNMLVLDLGTTGIKGFVFDARLRVLGRSYFQIHKTSPRPGWVEQDPMEILRVAQKALRAAVKESAARPDSFAGLALANQRETFVLWDKRTGKPVHPAIVWEDARTVARCKALRKKHGATVRRKTGLRLDPYFSASKVEWALKNIGRAAELARKDRLLFGTIDSWIFWNFLEGRPHVTDHTNASRTLLFNIHKLEWDKGLLAIFGVPPGLLPEVRPSASRFGVTRPELLGFPVPALAACGDQQASLFAAGGLKKGLTKVTYGTGAFVDQVIGTEFVLHPDFFTTLAPTLAARTRRPLYVLEAKVNDCGKRISAALGDPVRLSAAAGEIAAEVAAYLRKLPRRPVRLIADGKVTLYRPILRLQAQAAGIKKVERQKIYDGTALGAAMLSFLSR